MPEREYYDRKESILGTSPTFVFTPFKYRIHPLKPESNLWVVSTYPGLLPVKITLPRVLEKGKEVIVVVDGLNSKQKQRDYTPEINHGLTSPLSEALNARQSPGSTYVRIPRDPVIQIEDQLHDPLEKLKVSISEKKILRIGFPEGEDEIEAADGRFRLVRAHQFQPPNVPVIGVLFPYQYCDVIKAKGEELQYPILTLPVGHDYKAFHGPDYSDVFNLLQQAVLINQQLIIDLSHCLWQKQIKELILLIKRSLHGRFAQNIDVVLS